ncbi:MAG: (Fe-S)-binding protein [Nitrospinae bacterium]|nr:(Fe-S)-binding protein [Nitrospinota bacterium]
MRATLFITCLVDQFFPEVGEAMVGVLSRLGVELEFPEEQTCCGQPAFNGGFRREAARVARHFISVFEGKECIVAPSGSCTSMVKHFYPELFRDQPRWRERAEALSSRIHEFSEFLVRVLGVEDVGARYALPGGAAGSTRVAYHDSCHLLRELGISEEPRRLIRSVQGVELVDLSRSPACCGFGGIFSVKYPHISGAILQEKIEAIRESGAEVVVANDMGCLMHIAGGLSRQGIPLKAMHLAELLNGA